MDPVAKKILNSLSCPICQSPIDTVGSRHNHSYNYGCATNSDHYLINLILWEPVIRIEKERVNIYERDRKYSIVKFYIDNETKTLIKIYETDLESRVIFNFKEKKIIMDKDLFDFTNFNVDKAINRIKTIFVFQ